MIDLNTSEKYIPFIENAEGKLREICERRAVELYGEIPEIIKERLEFEISALKKSKEIEILLIFYRVLQNEEIKPYIITENRQLASLVVSYLLGIKKANPLPPHYRCKCGNYYDFDENNVSVGADLPDKLCPVCGKKLIKDGFNLHSKLVLFGENGEGSSYVELKVPKGSKKKIIDIIEKMPEIQPITEFPPSWITDEMRENNYGYDLRIIIPKYIDLEELYSLPHNFDVSTFLNKAYPFYTFRLCTDESLDWLKAMGEMSETDVDEIDFEGTNKLEYFRYNHHDIFTEVVNFKNNFDGVNGNVPNGVKTLSSYFFARCNELQTVNIPNSVEVIDDLAFANCSKIENLEIPHSVKKIGEFAFLSCKSLKKITIPGSVEEICYCAFECCDGLESVVIEKGLKKIGVSAFDFCRNLREVKIPDSVEEIGSQAFAYCDNLKKITIPKSVTKIGDSVFDLPDSEPKFVICCEKGSCADEWAENNNLAVEYTE